METKNGVCVHNKMLINCEVCYPQFQLEQNKKWLAKQQAIKEEYTGIKEAHALYASICGDPVQRELFH